MSRQSRSFLTDEQWQKVNYRKLIELAEDPETAQRIVDFLDDNPEIRRDLAGIYFRAQDTLRNVSR